MKRLSKVWNELGCDHGDLRNAWVISYHWNSSVESKMTIPADTNLKEFVEMSKYTWHPELEGEVLKLVEALRIIPRQNRSRGYPTGMEWMEIERKIKDALRESGYEE